MGHVPCLGAGCFIRHSPDLRLLGREWWSLIEFAMSRKS